ncbi:MAG: hypothetical protein ACREA3_10430, partial [Nitrosotalea sp.]
QQPVNGDVNYDLKILDSDGNTILSKTDLTAKNAVDTQTLNLPGNGIYNVQINIKSIVGPTGLPDTSRIGLARGNLVIPSTVGAEQGLVAIQNGTGNQTVPEFGPIASLVLVFAVVGVVIMSARTRGFLKL